MADTVMTLLKVSAKSNLHKVAGALAGSIREGGRAEMQAIGAGSLNQALEVISWEMIIKSISEYDWESEHAWVSEFEWANL